MWINRIFNQAIRGSFECYINAGKEITELDHVVEMNDDITNLDNSINLNLLVLNEEMGYDAKIKEMVEVEKVRGLGKRAGHFKNFIDLLNLGVEVVVDGEVAKLIKNEAGFKKTLL
jgi:hypothetical protein